jgi:predicted AAA+ superfamily ATPase
LTTSPRSRPPGGDPAGFVGSLAGTAIIDEIQKAPGLLPAIRATIDRDRRPGRFLLTGSADVLALPSVSESLAGRMEVATLWPLSQGEIAGRRERFIDRVFGGNLPEPHPVERRLGVATSDRRLPRGSREKPRGAEAAFIA